MKFQAIETPGQERKWLIEMSETEVAFVYAHCNFACCSMRKVNAQQMMIFQVQIKLALDPQFISNAFTQIYSPLPHEIYEFPRNLDMSRIGLPMDEISYKKAEEILKHCYKL